LTKENQLSTPHGTLGTGTVVFVKHDLTVEALSTPHGTLGTLWEPTSAI
jgi:hypothetical protein